MEKKDEEPPAVSIYVRPLEVTLTSEDLDGPPPVPEASPPRTVQTTRTATATVEQNTKRVWSTMSARIETETSVKRWSTPMVRTEEGTPPGPEDHPTTKQGRTLDGNVKTITPNYKIGEEKPNTDITLGRLGHLPEGYGDYKVSMRHEDYKQTFIDPKVKDFANMPSRVSAVPDAKKTIVGDFPSTHSKRSLINLEPLEQRRFKSVESRPITTSNYLTESVERHRDMEASRLRQYLKAKESDANQPWNKPGWTGPKKPADDESMRELEHIKKSIETLQKKAQTRSMQELHVLTPSQYDEVNPVTPQPQPTSSRDPGWLIKMRTNRYLDNTREAGLRKHKSMDSLPKNVVLSPYEPHSTVPRELLDVDSQLPPKDADPLHWQLRKEFHLSKYSERRQSWSASSHELHQIPESTRNWSEGPAVAPPPPPLPKETVIHQKSQPYSAVTTQPQRSRSQLLYPPGSTENIASEQKPQERPIEKTVYENKPIPAALIGVQVENKRQPSRNPEEDYPERLMSPPPGHPKSILKQQEQQKYQQQQQYYSSSSHQSYSAERQYQQQQEYYVRDSDDREPPSRTQFAPPPGQYAPPPLQQGQPTQQAMRPRSTTFQDLSEEERHRIMQENLMKHRQQRAPSVQKQPVTSFNGPFFKLEEVAREVPVPNGHVPREDHHREYYQKEENYSLQHMKEMSASEIELDRHLPGGEEPTVVVWPPVDSKKRPRSQSVMAKNITDPERINELRRQQALEREAMRKREDEKMRSMEKQYRAMQIQQQRLYEQQHGVTSPVPIMDTISPTPQINEHYPEFSPVAFSPPPQNAQPINNHHYHPHMSQDPGPPGPQSVRVFETRPISSMSDMLPDNGPSWKRTYLVEKPKNVARNEIITSEELLEREQYEVDLLKRREAFVEKPDEPVEIHRTGRRWQPPPEKPYVWPTLRRPISVEPHMMQPMDFAPGVPVGADGSEYKWEPTIRDPGYKQERKNFTPTSSPPHSPRRGAGTGPLDEPARRQTKYVIQPSADGSHRPKPAFKKERHAPHGGFFPHAPNAIKVVKRRSASVTALNSEHQQQDMEDIEVIHQRNYHRLEHPYHTERSASAVDHKMKREAIHESHQDLRNVGINDWEKIYELPPHSSTLSGRDVPKNIDVRRRMNQFQGSIQNIQSQRRQQSIDSSHGSVNFPPPDYEPTISQGPPIPQQGPSGPPHGPPHGTPHGTPHGPPHGLPAGYGTSQKKLRREDHHSSRQQISSRRNSVSSAHLEAPLPVQGHSHHRDTRHRHDSQHSTQSRSQSRQSRSHSRAPSSIPLSPMPRGDTPNALRVRSHMARATAPSPTPLSYERARAYQPPALPSGYRLGDPGVDPRATSPSPGHTRRMVASVQESAQRLHPTPQTSRGPSRAPSRATSLRDHRLSPNPHELDRLGKNREQLEKSREMRSSYKLIDSEIQKEKPEPVPQIYKEHVRDMLESRNSIESSATKDNDRSGYQTDVSTATWQFSAQSFSPRSVVSVNGARDDILKKMWPHLPADVHSLAGSTQSSVTRNIRSEQKQRERYSSMSALNETPIIRVKDDKPRSIMKRRELESREQMMYPQNQVVEHKNYQRSVSNISARPQVTETVQRFEETRRTEEVERRVQRKERRERRSRHHSSSRHGREMWENGGNVGYERRVMSLPRQPALTYRESGRAMTDDEMNKVVREAYEAADEAKRQHRGRSSSVSRGNGYIPSSQENYYKQTTTKRDYNTGTSRHEDEAFGGRGMAHARYGSLSDSLRRGELKYIPNGEVREGGFVGQNGRNMHKSYSTRDVFGGDSYDRRSVSSHRRGSQQQMSPFVEFPPTLPRRGDSYRPVSKSRSYADWDDAGRAGFQGSGVITKRYDDDISRLEAEFRDSLLMPVPRGGNMNERDYRTEQIPGGYETFSKDNKANAGRRLGRDGQPVDFHESSQEYNFKREQDYDPRRR